MQSRRQFVTKAAATGAAATISPMLLSQLASATGVKAAGVATGFTDGVASGEPTPNSIVLWTRLAGAGATNSVQLIVSTDPGFSKTVAQSTIKTSSLVGGSVKAQVKGLKAHTQYYYKFTTAGSISGTGRFRTALPADSNATVKYAFFSCMDFTHGYFNAFKHMAEQDFDFVMMLGDFIYAETYHTVDDGTAVRDDSIGSPEPGYNGDRKVAQTLADYRLKYSLYRTDEHLKAVMAKFPVIAIWDDHEVQNNYAGGGGINGGLPANERYSVARRKAGYQAWFENMPTYGARKGTTTMYRRLQYGKTLDVIMMDQRQYRANQACDDAVVVACPTWDKTRAFLGKEQMAWVKKQLSASKANWKVMGNELTMMPTKVLGGSFFGFDSWQGYPKERAELLKHIDKNKIKNVVWNTGDIHTFIVGDVKLDGAGKTAGDKLGTGKSTGVEFVAGSVTSTCLGETDLPAGTLKGEPVIIKGDDANPNTPESIIKILRGINTWVEDADFDHHGYGSATVSSKNYECELVRMTTIKTPSTAVKPKAAGKKSWKWRIPSGAKTTVGHRLT
jgi:alkaline phosphatase D